MTTHSGWCLVGDHQHCKYLDCTCPCHGQIDGQEALLPDPRTRGWTRCKMWPTKR